MVTKVHVQNQKILLQQFGQDTWKHFILSYFGHLTSFRYLRSTNFFFKQQTPSYHLHMVIKLYKKNIRAVWSECPKTCHFWAYFGQLKRILTICVSTIFFQTTNSVILFSIWLPSLMCIMRKFLKSILARIPENLNFNFWAWGRFFVQNEARTIFLGALGPLLAKNGQKNVKQVDAEELKLSLVWLARYNNPVIQNRNLLS